MAQEKPQALFSRTAALGLVAVGALSLLFYVAFAAYAPDLSETGDSRENAQSRSAVGFAALAELLKDEDVSVVLSRGLVEKTLAKAGVTVLTPGLENDAAEIKAVTSTEPKLIILPKWVAVPDLTHPGWVEKGGTIPAAAIADRVLSPLSKASRLIRANGTVPARLRNGFNGTTLETGAIDSLQTISGGDWVGIVSDEKGHIVVGRLQGTLTYVLADPDLMNTQGLKALATARAAMAILDGVRVGKGPVIFDVTLAGYRRSPNFLRLAFEPPLLGATLCALLAALLMGLHAATRFGAAVEAGRAFRFGAQTLADNSAALIAMTHREHRIVIRYATAVRNRVARSIGERSAAYASDEALNAMLDRQRRAGSTTPPLDELFKQAREANDVGEALMVARKFYRWKREMIHEG